MSRPRSIYSLSMSSMFLFHLHFHYDYDCMNTDICFLAYFLEYVPLFLENNMDKECEKFSNSKSSASGCC